MTCQDFEVQFSIPRWNFFVSVSPDFHQKLPALQGESAHLGNLWAPDGFLVQI